MPLTVKLNLSNIGAANSSHERTAAYAAGSGNPSWVTVSTTGNIDLSNPGNADKNKTVNISWTLPSDFAANFDGTNPFSSEYTDFAVVSGANTKTLTVSDTNNDPTPGNEYSYSLKLSDGTFIDPKVINY